MWRFPKRLRLNERGNLLQTLGILAAIGALTLVFSQMFMMKGKIARKKIKYSRSALESGSLIETVLMAYRLSEIKYILGVSSCDSARPFLQALKNGSDCATVPEILVFNGTDEGTQDGIYQFLNPCRIRPNSTTCPLPSVPLMQFSTDIRFRSVATESGEQTQVFLVSANPEEGLLEMRALVQEGSSVSQVGFAIRPSLSNSAHLEVDGRVTQENPDPLDVCPGTRWADFLVFNPRSETCERFATLGSGTGLAFHEGRYFGFRPMDGSVIDLQALGTSPSYLVEETGVLDGEQVFPPHNREALINVDDITVIGDQLYYVALGSEQAHIGGLNNGNRMRLCPLGQMGWSQSYEGIAAHGASIELMGAQQDNQSRLATFYLKTSAGDFLTAMVLASPDGLTHTCHVFKDTNLQQIEFSRTYGFDRTDGAKPYFVY